MLVAEAIALHRERQGLTQKAFAERLGVRQQTVSRWEAGQALPPPSWLVQLEDEFALQRGTLLRMGGYLPDEEHSGHKEGFRQLLGIVPELSDAELLLLIDLGWQTYRNRQCLTVDGSS